MINLQPKLHSRFHRMITPPTHPFHFIWSSVICLIIVYFVLEIIFVSCFDLLEPEFQAQLRVAYLVLWTLLLLDIPINLFKAKNNNGIHQHTFKQIATQYLRSKFVVDAISVTTLLLSIVIPHPNAVYLRFAILLRIWDLFKLQKIVFKLLLHHHFLRELSTISKIFLFELFVIHCASCLFYLIGRLLVKYEYYGNPVINSDLYWLTTSVVSSPIIQLSLFEQYLWSFYFGAGVISTIVIGDIVGHNPIETGFVLIMIFIGTISEAYLFEVIVQAWGASYERIKDYLKNLHVTTNFMRNNDIPNRLQHEVQTYLEFRWLEQHHQNNQEETRILSKLPRTMKSKIILSKFSEQLTKINLFQMIQPSSTLFSELAQSFTESYYFDSEILINSFSLQSYLILVAQGKTEEFFQYTPISDQLQNYYHSSKKIIGMEKFITGMLGRRVIKAKTRVTALTMERKDFKNIIKKNGEINQEFQFTAHSISYNNNYSKIYEQCQCCGESIHNVMDCQECHVAKRADKQGQEHQRTKKSRSRMTRSKRGSSNVILTSLDEFFSQRQIRESEKKKRIQKYVADAWQKIDTLTKELMGESGVALPQKPQASQPFEEFCMYQNYYPMHNIVSGFQ